MTAVDSLHQLSMELLGALEEGLDVEPGHLAPKRGWFTTEVYEKPPRMIRTRVEGLGMIRAKPRLHGVSVCD